MFLVLVHPVLKPTPANRQDDESPRNRPRIEMVEQILGNVVLNVVRAEYGSLKNSADTLFIGAKLSMAVRYTPSNGRIKGTNNLIPVLRRNAHGFTNVVLVWR